MLKYILTISFFLIILSNCNHEKKYKIENIYKIIGIFFLRTDIKNDIDSNQQTKKNKLNDDLFRFLIPQLRFMSLESFSKVAHDLKALIRNASY